MALTDHPIGDWTEAIDRLARGECTLLGLWADDTVVQMALLDTACRIERVSHRCRHGSYPSVGASHPPALRLERAIRDLLGLKAVGSPDARPWLDLGFWNVERPLAATPSQRHASQP